MNLFALGLYVVWFAGVFVWRSIRQKRATGDSGFRGLAFRSGANGVARASAALFAIALAAGLGAPVFAIAGLDPLWRYDVASYVGAGAAVLGAGLTFVAQSEMGQHWRVGVDADEQTTLVTTGIFGAVRNPVFSAMALTAAGFVAMVPNMFSVLALLTLVVAVQLQVRGVEEPYLRELHGLEYDRYARRVGRFVPRLRRSGVRR